MSNHSPFVLAGVMGWPIMHSRSPRLHNYWLAHYGLTGAYVPLAIEASGLEAALRALPALGFSGCNLTIPHKEAALRIVDDRAALLDTGKLMEGVALDPYQFFRDAYLQRRESRVRDGND